MNAFLLSLGIVVITVALYSVIGRQTDKLWNEMRDIQNVYFRTFCVCNFKTKLISRMVLSRRPIFPQVNASDWRCWSHIWKINLLFCSTSGN